MQIFHPRMKKYVILLCEKIQRKMKVTSHMNFLTTLEWNKVILVSVKCKQERGIEFIPEKNL